MEIASLKLIKRAIGCAVLILSSVIGALVTPQTVAAVEGGGAWGYTVLRRATPGKTFSRPHVAVGPFYNKVAVVFVESGRPMLAERNGTPTSSPKSCGVANWECIPLDIQTMLDSDEAAINYTPDGSLWVAWIGQKNGFGFHTAVRMWQRTHAGVVYTTTVEAQPDAITYLAYFAQPSIAVAGDDKVLVSYKRTTYDGDRFYYDYQDMVVAKGFSSGLSSSWNLADKLGDDAIEEWESGYGTENGNEVSVSVGASTAFAYRAGNSNRTLRYGVLASTRSNSCEDITANQPDAYTSCHTVDAAPSTGKSISLYAGRGAIPTQMTYVDYNNGHLKRARWVGGSSTCNGGNPGWACEVIDNIGSQDGYAEASMTMAYSRTVVAYHDVDSGGVLKVARLVNSGGNCGGGLWRCDLVDNGVASLGIVKKIGREPSAASNPNGYVAIAYMSIDGDLLVATEKKPASTFVRTLPAEMQQGSTYLMQYFVSSTGFFFSPGTLTGAGFQEVLPTGLAVQSVNLGHSGCGGNVVSVDPVLNKVVMANGMVDGGATGCRIDVWIKAVGQPGTHSWGSTTRLSSVERSDAAPGQATVKIIAPVVNNTPPTISAVADQVVPMDTSTGLLPYTVTDNGPFTVTVQTSNAQLLPLAGITMIGSGTNRNIRVTPFSGRTGIGIVTLNVTDGQLTTSESFAVTVMGENVEPEPEPLPGTRVMLPMVTR